MENRKSRLWEGFWQIADPKIWVASTVPMAVAAALAFSTVGSFNLLWFALTLIAVYLIEIGKNALNEVIDYNSGVDRFVTADKRTPFSGGKKTIVDGKLTLKENSVIAVATIALAAIIGIYIALAREYNVLWVGLAGVFLAVFYSLPPVKLAYRGLGEVAVGLTFGPLIVSGTYLVQAGTLSWTVVLASLPICFLIANVLWINQYPDYEADSKGDKRNWLVRLGKQKGIKVYAALFSLAYASLLVLTAVTGNYWWLLPFATIPMAVRAVKVASLHYDNIPLLMEANGKTVQIYQLVGITMVAAALLPRLL